MLVLILISVIYCWVGYSITNAKVLIYPAIILSAMVVIGLFVAFIKNMGSDTKRADFMKVAENILKPLN